MLPYTPSPSNRLPLRPHDTSRARERFQHDFLRFLCMQIMFSLNYGSYGYFYTIQSYFKRKSARPPSQPTGPAPHKGPTPNAEEKKRKGKECA